MKNNKLVIVAGAGGEIGKEFCKKIVDQKIDCLAIVRNKRVEIESPFFRETQCELTDMESVIRSFISIDFKKYREIIFLHTIGSDKFDPRGYPYIEPLETIPPEIYNSNVNSFKYLLRFCLD